MLAEQPQIISLTQLAAVAGCSRGHITQLYLHWTAGRYGQVYDDYHLNIDADGTVYRTSSTDRQTGTSSCRSCQRAGTEPAAFKCNDPLRSSATGWLRPLQRRRRNTLGPVVYARFTRRRTDEAGWGHTARQSSLVFRTQ